MASSKRPLKICALGAASSVHVVARSSIYLEYGHDVTLISPVEGDTGTLKSIICARGNRPGILGKIGWFIRILKTVSQFDANIYHVHYAAEPTSWAAWLLRKKPLVITVMGADVFFDEQGSLGTVARYLTRRTLKAADLVTAKSALLGTAVEGFGLDCSKIKNVIWGIDQRIFKINLEAAQQQRVNWGIDPAKKILFSPRMLKPLYNQHLMVEALPEILEQFPETVLVLSTYQQDKKYRHLVENTANGLAVTDHLYFVPPLKMQDMAAAYSASQAVLSLPPSDGTPQSVMEAMACGVPVVMSDLERFRELFRHKETTWFSALDAGPVAEGVNNIFGNADLSETISRNAMNLVKEKADFETQARQVEDMYYQLLENGRVL